MNARSLLALAAMVLLVPPSVTIAQDKKSDAADDRKAATPGPIHKKLAKLAGDYTTATKVWASPGSKPMESTGTAKLTSILGGRFLSEEISGSQFGQPYEGTRLIGYNDATKRFEATWAWTMSTGLMTLNGVSDDDGKTINWTASFDDATGKKQTLLVVNKQLDDDRFSLKVIGKAPDGGEGLVMETVYTRKK